MTRKILVAYGDGQGPAVIRAAESVLKTVAPDLEIHHGRIGKDAYENTSYAFPPDTIELTAQCEAVLSGPVDMTGVPGRNPLGEIKKQMELTITYNEYFSLCDYLGNEDINLKILSPTIESNLRVFETESPDGISSEFYTSIESIDRIFDKVLETARLIESNAVHLVSDGTMFPARDNLFKESFERHFKNTEFLIEESTTTESMCYLAHDPGSLDMVMCDIPSALCLWGQAAGITGGSGLMPQAFLGNGKGLFTVSPKLRNENMGRELNPTSAILSAAVLLLHLGMPEEYNSIRRAVCEMYRTGHTTPDIGGKLNAKRFSDEVCRIIKMDNHP